MKILAVGDSFMLPRCFRDAFAGLEAAHDVNYLQIDADRPFTPTTKSELTLREVQGSPKQLVDLMTDVEVLVVHGAPVSDEVLDAATDLRLVCCARGGPVNVDVDAMTARGLPLVVTPGKNAEAVADLTLAFLVMLARGTPRAQRFLEDGRQLKDNWEGAQFIGSDLRGHELGLIGYGQIGLRVASRARAFGLSVLVYDPFRDVPENSDIQQLADVDELLSRADFVSLHARATAENENLIGPRTLALMKRGSNLVNTARETLVDEEALDEALASGHLAGAALDVVRPTSEPGRHRLLRHENVVLTPHIGGATNETLLQGAEMVAAEIVRFAAGEPLSHVANRVAVS